MMTTVLGVLILVCALFLVIAVLLQSSKNHRMSGVVSGGAETFFGKQKGKTIDATLSKVTAVIAVIFAVLVFALYVKIHNDTKAAEAKAAAEIEAAQKAENAAQPNVDLGSDENIDGENIGGESNDGADNDGADNDGADNDGADNDGANTDGASNDEANNEEANSGDTTVTESGETPEVQE